MRQRALSVCALTRAGHLPVVQKLSHQIFVLTPRALWFLNLSEKPNLKSKFLRCGQTRSHLKQFGEPRDQSWKVMPLSPNWHRLTCSLPFSFWLAFFTSFPVDWEHESLSSAKWQKNFLKSFNYEIGHSCILERHLYPNQWITRHFMKKSLDQRLHEVTYAKGILIMHSKTSLSQDFMVISGLWALVLA